MPHALSSEFPPASLIICFYNQEKFVEAAVHAAFAQDYPNLEIVFSDDCSSDGTFAALTAAVAAYEGPHRVVLNRTAENAGTLPHLYSAVARAAGELLVLGAGDDLSHPNRVSTVVDFWQRHGGFAFYSRYNIIDEKGRLLQKDLKIDQAGLALRDYFPGRQIETIHGASSAYHRAVFERFPNPGGKILYEDSFFTLFMNLHDMPVRYIDATLVDYREHGQSVTNYMPPSEAAEEVRRRETWRQVHAASTYQILRLFAEAAPWAANNRPLQDDLAIYDFRSRWIRASLLERARMIPRMMRRGHAKWLAPRLLGLRPLMAGKWARARLKGLTGPRRGA
jgi:glycosyltransferase involved in cell wall biosynthesis